MPLTSWKLLLSRVEKVFSLLIICEQLLQQNSSSAPAKLEHFLKKIKLCIEVLQ